MGYRPVRWTRITNAFAAPGDYATKADSHGPAGHHSGLDYGKHLVPLIEIAGKPVRASLPGTVVISEWNSWAGNMVGVWNEREDLTITYWHLADRQVGVGAVVRQGRILGHVGSTGNSTAPHLHVQANRGRTFDYHAHLPPAPWTRGAWVGSLLRRLRGRRDTPRR